MIGRRATIRERRGTTSELRVRALSPLAPLSGLRVERESTVGLSRDSPPPLPAWWPVPLPAASLGNPRAPFPLPRRPHHHRRRRTPPPALSTAPSSPTLLRRERRHPRRSYAALHTPLRALSNRNRANHGRVRIRDARDTIEVSGIRTGLTRPDARRIAGL